MPGVDLTQISSNWKKLQTQLKGNVQDARDSISDNLKRKRYIDDQERKSRGSKRQKIAVAKSNTRGRVNERMGAVLSANEDHVSDAAKRSELQQKFDIPAVDMDDVYREARDIVGEGDVNGGRHVMHKAGRYLALDCEMVGTGPPPHTDDLLARVSLVNFHGELIYDSYVQPVPGSRVEDYRTHVSGIRREHLRPGTARPFEHVQKDVTALLSGKILVGHALRKDIQALQLDHPKRDIRDTSRYPPYRIESRGKPPALRHLAKTHLGLTIQKGEHSSIEDARATMMLYKREKAGFEAENRKQFGVVKQVKGARPAPAEEAQDLAEDDADDFDSEADDMLLSDEEVESISKTEPGPTTAVKKRKKKKKRTKR